MAEQLVPSRVTRRPFSGLRLSQLLVWFDKLRRPNVGEGTARLTIGLCLAAGVTAGMQMGKAPLGLPGIRSEFDLGLDTAAWIVSAFPLIGAFIGVFAGGLAQRLGARRSLFVGLITLACGGMLSYLSISYVPVLIGRTIEGIGFLAITISAPTLIHTNAEGPERRFAMTIWSACVPIGVALTLLAGPLVTSPFGWRGLWLAGACQVILVIPTLAILLPHATLGQSSRGRSPADMLKVITLRRPVSFAIVAGCYMFLFSMTALFPVMFVDRFGLGLRTASELVSPVILTGLAGGLFARWLGERGLAPWTSIVICAGVMGCAGVGLFTPGAPLAAVYGLCIIFAASAGMLPAIAFEGAAASVPDPSLVPIAMGMVMQASNIGVFVGPIGFGAAIQAGGWTAGTGPLLAITGVLFAMAMLLRESARRGADAS